MWSFGDDAQWGYTVHGKCGRAMTCMNRCPGSHGENNQHKAEIKTTLD
jgi:hypothetical protein